MIMFLIRINFYRSEMDVEHESKTYTGRAQKSVFILFDGIKKRLAGRLNVYFALKGTSASPI